MNLRKVITISASALLLLSVGASASTCTTSNASASRVSRLEARKSRDYRDIRSINAQLAKLQRHSKRGRRHNVRRNRKRVVRRHLTRKHESQAQYYKNNAKGLKYRYMSNKDFKKGWDDTETLTEMNPSYKNNKMYRNGWITGYVNNGTGGDFSKDSYAHAIHYYNDGIAYINQNNPAGNITFDAAENEWGYYGA